MDYSFRRSMCRYIMRLIFYEIIGVDVGCGSMGDVKKAISR
jgi:hypothetical protein